MEWEIVLFVLWLSVEQGDVELGWFRAGTLGGFGAGLVRCRERLHAM